MQHIEGGVDGSVVSTEEKRSVDHCWDDGQSKLLQIDPC